MLPLGTESCPWKLQAKTNQKIQIYLKSLKKPSCDIDQPDVSTCKAKFITFRENNLKSLTSSSRTGTGLTTRQVDICVKKNQPSGLLYTSTSHELDVYFSSTTRGATDRQYMLFFKFRGKKSLIRPKFRLFKCVCIF